MICNKCGTEIKNGETVCPWCDTPIEITHHISDSSSISKNICTTCGTKLAEGAVECPWCGTKFGTNPPPLTEICKKCGFEYVVYPGTDKCPRCGYLEHKGINSFLKYFISVAACLLLVIGISSLLVGKDDSPGPPTPTPTVSVTPTQKPTPTPTQKPTPTPTTKPNSTADSMFNGTYWDMLCGQTQGSTFTVRFNGDGTFGARNAGSGTKCSGTYKYSNGELKIEFSGEYKWASADYVGDKNGFVSVEKYEMQVGSDYYYIEPNGDKEFYQNGYATPSTPTPVPNNATVTTSKECYGRIISYTSDMLEIEKLNYNGRDEFSYNYVLEPTGKKETLDISNAVIALEYAWSSDYEETRCSSIGEALNTPCFDGTLTVNEALGGYIEICYTVQNGHVTKVLILYAA